MQDADSKTPLFEAIDLFETEKSDYVTGRIPVLIHAGEGCLIAAWEARKPDQNGYPGDWVDIDILYRRSEDGGRTWSPAAVLADPGTMPAHNANFLVDARGRLHFVYFVNYARAFHCVSRDRGATFSEPREITETFRKFDESYLWNVIAGGPGHGIVTRQGRLIIPVWLSNGGHKHRPSVVSAIYSDDDGETWQSGEIIPPKLPNMSETVGVEAEDGSILFNIRSEDRAHRRAWSRSPDGATRWSAPWFDDALKEPICMGNLCRVDFATSGRPGRILFSNPDNDVYSGQYGPSWDGNKDRVNLTVKMSYDDGATWPVSRVVDPGIAGYSDLAHDGKETFFLLYERGGVNDSMWVNRYVTLVRFNSAWLTASA